MHGAKILQYVHTSKKKKIYIYIYIYIEQQETVKEQCNKERDKIIVKDPQNTVKYFITFLNCKLQCAH